MSTTRSAPWLPERGLHRRSFLLVLAGLSALLASPARFQADENARQVTLCGIIATPDNGVMDPKLSQIEPQLHKLLPDHGFKLLGVRTRRLLTGQSILCNLGGAGGAAEAILIDPLDDNGKVRLKCAVTLNGITQLGTSVTTPPNQLFFCDQKLRDGSHLLIGIGAR